MALNLILGDKKSGKTTYVLNGLGTAELCTLIVPEQTLFKYESLILDKLGEENASLINTLSFKKLAISLMKNEESYNSFKLLDNDTRSLIVERILLENKDKLTVFSKSVKKPEFADEISSQITEFKKHLITCDYLKSLTDDERITKGLREKLIDLNIIYSAYEERVNDIFKDTDDIITYAAKKIADEGIYKGKNIYIDGFTGFTKDELFMIEAFLANGAEVYITLPLRKGEKEDKGELFYSVKKAEEKLKKLADKIKIKVNEIYISTDFIKPCEIKFLKENYEDDEKRYDKSSDNISVYKCRNVYYECVNLLTQIADNVRYENARLSDIAVIVPDIESYAKHIEDLFDDFSIAYYCNEKVSVYDLSVAMLLGNLFEIILSSNKLDVLLNYVKSGYFCKSEPEKIYHFENFIKNTGIKAYTLFTRPFTDIINEKKMYNFSIDNEDELVYVYNKAILPVISLKERLRSEKTADGYSLCLYEYFKEIELEKTISDYADDYEEDGKLIKGEQLIQVYNYIVESMERASVVLSGYEVEFIEYKDIILSGLKNKNIASIPLLNDSVMICDLKGFSDNSYKYIYVLGALEGKIPDTSFNEGLINETERDELSGFGMEMSLSYELKLNENYLKLYDVLTSTDKKLIISYPVFDKSGEENIRAEFVSDIISMFDLTVKKEREDVLSKRQLLKETLSEISKTGEIKSGYKYLAGYSQYKEILDKILSDFGKSTVKDVRVSEEKVHKLLRGNLNLSVTNLEKYSSCAFSYFLRYILKAREDKGFSINTANTGSLLHSILEMFSRELIKDDTDFSKIDNGYISDKLDKIVKKAVKNLDNGVFETDLRSSFLIKKVRRMAEYTINLIKLHFVKGSFEPVGFEMKFGFPESEISPLTFDIGKGRKIVLNGVIDRVDKLSADDGEYIRIVDYKSTGKTIDFYEIFAGIKLQLAVYILTVLKQDTVKNLKPGGMLYLSLDTPIISIKNPLDTEDLELKIRKEHIMTGIFLNNCNVITAMDNELKTADKSEIIDVKFDKNGIINGKNTLTLKEFEYMLSSVVDKVKEEARLIYEGDFSINPVLSGGKKACLYCPYSSVCMFEDGASGYKVIEKAPKNKLFAEMAGESE